MKRVISWFLSAKPSPQPSPKGRGSYLEIPGTSGNLRLCSFALVFLFAVPVCAQNLRVVIQVVPESNRVIIEGSCAPTKVWSFRDSYAGILGLGGRVERLKLFDNADAEIPYRKIAPGQFASDASASRFQYEVRLTTFAAASDAVKVSWLNAERGLLMLGDLLPTTSVTTDDRREKGRIAIRFELPPTWSVHSNENETRPSNFAVVDSDDAVFVVGSRLRVSRTTVSGMAFNLVVDGDWAFTDSEASELTAKVLKAHRDVFSSIPAKQSTLILLPFQGLAADRLPEGLDSVPAMRSTPAAPRTGTRFWCLCAAARGVAGEFLLA